MMKNILFLSALLLTSSCGVELIPLLALKKTADSVSTSTRSVQPVMSCDSVGFHQLVGDTEKNINVKLYRELVEDVLDNFNRSGRDVKNFWKNLPARLRQNLSYSLSLIAVEENIKSKGLYEAMPLYIYVLSNGVAVDSKVKITDKYDSKDKFAFKLRGLDAGNVYSNSGCGKSAVNRIGVEVPENVVTRADITELWRCVSPDLSFHILESAKDNYLQTGPGIIRIQSNVFKKSENTKSILISADQDTLLLNLDINKRRYYTVERFRGRETRAEIQSAFLKVTGTVSCNSLLKEI